MFDPKLVKLHTQNSDGNWNIFQKSQFYKLWLDNSFLTLWISIALPTFCWCDDIIRSPLTSAYFLFSLIYHFNTWALHRLNLSLRCTTGSSLKHMLGWAPSGAVGAECSPYAPALSPSPALLLCLPLVMDDLWAMMNRLLSGPQHTLIWDSAIRREEHNHHPANLKIQLISPEARWLLTHSVIWMITEWLLSFNMIIIM